MGYILEIIKKDGDVSQHYYDDIDSLEYDAVFCRYSTNIIAAIGKEDIPFGKTLFVIS